MRRPRSRKSARVPSAFIHHAQGDWQHAYRQLPYTPGPIPLPSSSLPSLFALGPPQIGDDTRSAGHATQTTEPRASEPPRWATSSHTQGASLHEKRSSRTCFYPLAARSLPHVRVPRTLPTSERTPHRSSRPHPMHASIHPIDHHVYRRITTVCIKHPPHTHTHTNPTTNHHARRAPHAHSFHHCKPCR